MAYNVIIKPEAYLDIDEAMEWYQKQPTGLEIELYHEIFDAIDYISQYPKHFQKKYKTFRIKYTDKFRYGIHYTIEKNTVFIHAVLHTAREPRD